MTTVYLIGSLTVLAAMVGAWIVQQRTKNAALVDAIWAFGIGFMAVVTATAGEGAGSRRFAVGLTAGAWALRLGLHLLRDRILGKPEEGRYVDLRRAWGAAFQIRLLGFYLAQGVLVALLAVPFALAAMDTAPWPAAYDLAALLLVAIGLVGESIADRQLARFKAASTDRSAVCSEGLWRYSRHPNYFFEWLIWCGFGVAALGAPFGWLGLGAPALMAFFILRVTGIPPTEAQALRSRGEAYRRYQERTSAFIPWFPKRDESSCGSTN